MEPVLGQKFALCGDGIWSSSEGPWLCSRGPGEYFEIPESANTLWLSLHQRNAADRLPLKVGDLPPERSGLSCNSVGIWINGKEATLARSVYVYLRRLTPYIGKTLYLEAWYE